MRSRAVRVTVTLLAVGAMAAAAYLTWASQSHLDTVWSTASQFEATRGHALRNALELRSAQQSYVAAGQSESFWFGKVTAAADALRSDLSALSSTNPSPAVRLPLDTASLALQDFLELDARARSLVNGGQRVAASDMIFSDGLETAGRMIAALDDAGRAAGSEANAAMPLARRQATMALTAAASVVLIALMLLGRRSEEQKADATAPASLAPRAEDGVSMSATDGLDLTPVVRDQRPPAPAEPAPVEWKALADVCGELARLSDTTGLAAVLERAAGALDATGIVLWVVDPDGKELMPVAAHGYPGNVLARMGTLKVEAENATADAFRTGLVQTVKSDVLSHGAIAAPLLTPGGCRGVMSAEVRHQGETQPGRLAAASIVASQLAALLGPPAARTAERTAAI